MKIRIPLRVGFTVFAVAALTLSGCTQGPASNEGTASVEPRIPLAELKILEHPKDFEGPSSAALADTEIVPITDNPAQTLPATVMSHDKNGDLEFTITDTSRVVAADISGTVAASIWGLGFGDTIIGRSMAATFPGMEDIPTITTGGPQANVEAILELKPTLVITDGTVGPVDVIEQMRDAGVPVIFVENAPSFEGAQELVRQVAAVYGAPETGEELAQKIKTDIDAKIAEIAQIAPSGEDDKLRIAFVYLRGKQGIYFLFGINSGADSLIQALSGRDVATEIGWEHMKPMTDEAMVAMNPDLILVMTKGLESAGGVDALLETKPAIALTTAGEKRRFVDMADGDILSFGPRSADILDALARAIYAPEE